MKKVTFTHKGWLGICPIHVHLDPLLMHPRHWVFWPLMIFSQATYGLIIFVQCYIFGESSWEWGTCVQEMDKPVTKKILLGFGEDL